MSALRQGRALGDGGTSRNGGAHGNCGAAAPVVRLRRIRVLLVGRDRRFVRTATVLLGRHGCDVASIARAGDLLEQVERERPNVVVIDATGSLSATARAVAALEALPGPVAAVVVWEGDVAEPMRHLRMLPKWGGFDAIVAAVERAYGGAGAAREGAGSPHGAVDARRALG